ncbi:hypothetical protein AWQ21_14675 (plasmid) [Picosynechococcus sp. PCC 7003]|uniref:hypothetical protein n=1 Tax=Picosynechococcus sp. PCC 7003 TaxID=374981 RepID=UPI0008105651|nr:hypothetical protein [Picosynechococcus sp. PCC 7003]ANV85776.1 hypothetical protein AWQ21_14675 [Picosynechococcus sp. PCC 7003]
MTTPHPTQPKPGPSLKLLDHIEATGEVDECPELVLLIEELVRKEAEQGELSEEPPVPAISPEAIATYEQELSIQGTALKKHCQKLYQALSTIETIPEAPFTGAPAEIQNHIEQIQRAIIPIMNLSYRYRGLLQTSDRRDGITHCYYTRGLSYCTHFIAQKTSVAAITAEFNTALQPTELLNRIYRYLDQLPSLYHALTNRLLQTLWTEVPSEDGAVPLSFVQASETPNQEEI